MERHTGNIWPVAEKKLMWLCNLHNAVDNNTISIGVNNGLISAVGNSMTGTHEPSIYFEGATVIPGLINSHDHLDFNLYPQLGNRIYTNYTEWGSDIHSQNKEVIDAVLKIPEGLRTEWGLYKNLLSGVTTVVNHGKKTACTRNLITVYQEPVSLHSAAFEKRLRYKLLNPFQLKKTVVIHAGEGTDVKAESEINVLHQWNMFRKKIVAVHGVAMTAAQAKKTKALVWCPCSNYFLLDTTAPVHQLKNFTKILFGTDSTLTAHWNIWEHLRMALQTKQLNSTELWQCLTTAAAAVWKLNKGTLSIGKDADMVVIKGNTKSMADGSVFSTQPEDILLVMQGGNIKLLDDSLWETLPKSFLHGTFSRITINNTQKWVTGNLPALMQQILNYYPDATFPVEAG